MGDFLQENPFKSLLCGEPARRPTEGTVFESAVHLERSSIK
jgi:hypothetical protein